LDSDLHSDCRFGSRKGKKTDPSNPIPLLHKVLKVKRNLKTVEETSSGRMKMMRKEKDQATSTAKVTSTGCRYTSPYLPQREPWEKKLTQRS
jgi:hypothetical protein